MATGTTAQDDFDHRRMPHCKTPVVTPGTIVLPALAEN
jgi:hypothetical protein